MNTRTHPRIVSLAMTIVMALTMIVSASALDIVPANEDTTQVLGNLSTSGQTYYARVVGPADATRTKLEMTLYEKNLFGYKEVDSAAASANSDTCSKTVSYAFKENKQYKLTVTGSAYVNGSWDTVTKDFT